MLGRNISDPDGIESAPGESDGLGLLDVETRLAGQKTLRYVGATDVRSGLSVSGYEMHIGDTDGPDTARPMLMVRSGRMVRFRRTVWCPVVICGLFADDTFREDFLERLKSREPSRVRYEQQVEQTLDALAEHCERHIDLDGISKVAGVA